MPDLTFVLPVADYHKDIAARAIASVEAQTVPCEIVVFADVNHKGAGFARNRGLESVKTPYVAFLDADDTVAPQFAEACLAAIEPNHYVYTNWEIDGAIIEAPSPCDVWTKKTYHIVTTVMHTDDVRRIGGFDELLPGAEDTDLGVRLRLSGICGIRLPFPLFHYGDAGRRSIELKASGKEASVLAYFNQRYGGHTLMGCCGDNVGTHNQPGNVPQEGDVLAMAIWGGNRAEWGRATGRLYPVSGNRKLLYVDPRDIDAAPQHWQRVTQPATVNGVVLQPQYQPRNDWQMAANAIFGGAQQTAPAPTQSSPVEYKPMAAPRSKSDVLKLVKGE